MPKQLHCIREKLSLGYLPRDQDEESLICLSLPSGQDLQTPPVHSCACAHLIPAGPKSRLKSHPLLEMKIFAEARQPKWREKKASAMGVTGRSCSAGHFSSRILQSPGEPAVGSVKMLCCVISAWPHVLHIKVQPPEDRELCDFTHHPSIIPDHLSETGLGQSAPRDMDGRQERAIADFSASSNNQAGKNVQSKKSGSRSTQAGSRK